MVLNELVAYYSDNKKNILASLNQPKYINTSKTIFFINKNSWTYIFKRKLQVTNF